MSTSRQDDEYESSIDLNLSSHKTSETRSSSAHSTANPRKELELSTSVNSLQKLQDPSLGASNKNYHTTDDRRLRFNGDAVRERRANDKWTFSVPSKAISLTYPRTKSQSSNENANNATASTSIGGCKGPNFLGWEFSHQNSKWSVSSKTILTVTYTPADHAVPSFTRKNIGVDYIQRMFKRSKRSASSSSSDCCFKGKKVYEERFDADDIQSVRFIDSKDMNVNVNGYHDCHGVQIMLRSKFAGVGVAQRFPINKSDEDGLDPGNHNTSREMPLDGSKVLKENGYLSEDIKGIEDGVPLPPWRQANGSGVANGGEEVYGPIVTFLVADVSASQSKSRSNANENAFRSEEIPIAPPLIWKVQFPPDPSIALEALTVLDGSLDIHSDDIDINNEALYRSGEGESTSLRTCTASYPTNIYLNGYQSWSFAGSVTQGDEQPKSAMPNFLSKAFNYGADIPPAPTDENDFDGPSPSTSSSYSKSNAGRWKNVADCRNGGRSFGVSGSSSSIKDTGNFRDLTHYKSDFYTCVSCNNAEDAMVGNDYDGLSISDGNGNGKLDENGGPAMVLGFLSQNRQYGLVTFDSDLCCVAMHASLQGVVASRSEGICTDWAYCQILSGDYFDEEPMATYLHSVCSYNAARPLERFPPLTGWCSWYHYYENIDSSTLIENFKELSNLKSKITSDAVIIDDGYMTSWGDWSSLKPKGFPRTSGGMKALADSISSHNMIPGVWMAPYACDKNSKLAQEHPDWIIRNDEGRFANSSNCGKFFYGLDATNPEVREYAFKCTRRAVQEWGFKVLKLDFLYAACLVGNGKYDLSMSRAETMHLALQTLRAAAGPETFIIGCGCPIGPAIGLIDANRISADTGPTWYPDFPLPWWDHATLPSLRAMVRNTITRSCLGHRFWHNDPDCILLGDTTRLTDAEVKSAATVIAMTGGMLLLSDDLSKLSNERLRVGSRIFPVTGVTGTTLDLHNTSESGIPSLIRLWCTDEVSANFKSSTAVEMASINAKTTSFSLENPWDNVSDRSRNCLPVTKGLGTWSILSLSNWLDESADVSVPFSASVPPKKKVDAEELHLGYHVFSFWMSKYAWVAANQSSKNIRKRLGPHESEIFHVKAVSLECGQYIGSELHFTCGYEVITFHSTSSYIDLQLRNDLKRSGFVYLYLPCYSNTMKINMSGRAVRGEVVFRTPKIGHRNTFYGGQVIRIWVVVNGNGSIDDGRVIVKT